MCDNLDEPRTHLVKAARGKRTNIVWIHLNEVPSVVQFIEAETRIVIARDWRKGSMGNYFFNGYRVSVWDKKFWRWKAWWLHSDVNVINTTEHLKNV